jgi:hypothetical protein
MEEGVPFVVKVVKPLLAPGVGLPDAERFAGTPDGPPGTLKFQVICALAIVIAVADNNSNNNFFIF